MIAAVGIPLIGILAWALLLYVSSDKRPWNRPR